MNLITRDTATSSAESRKTSQELSQQADELQQLVSGFTLPIEQVAEQPRPSHPRRRALATR
jgi:hypothetical protein